MNEWKTSAKKEQFNNPVLIVGLPGIANVGKLAVDFLIEELKAVKIAEYESYSRPHVVFVNEKNLVELPTITLFAVKQKKQTLLLLSGDYQPIDEQACFTFCDKTITLVSELGCKQIITLGGIALRQEPKKAKVYCTGTSKTAVQAIVKGTTASEKVHGVVGPIIGVSGVMLGLAAKRKINAVALLAETFGHPAYLGITGAKEILDVLAKKFSLKIKTAQLKEDITELEGELAKMKDLAKQKIPSFKGKIADEANYIG